MLSNVGIERAILASICSHGKDVLIDIEDVGVKTESFTEFSNQAIYKCLQLILQKHNEVDQALLLISLKENGYEALFNNRKDIEYLGSLFNFPVKQQNARSFAIKLEKLNIARKAINKHREAIENLQKITGSEEIDNIIQLSENPIFDLVVELNKHNNDGPQLLFDKIQDVLEYLKSKNGECVGIATPWPRYNDAIGGGLRRGGVNLISARPKIGKTTMAKECMVYCSSKLKIPCLFLDTEMTLNDQVIRSISSNSNVPLNVIETGEFKYNRDQLDSIVNICKQLQQNDKLYYESIAGKPFEEILAIIRRWIVKNVGFDDDGRVNDCVVVYDYFKLMDKSHLGNLKEYEALGYQISKLTDFCKEYDFPCLAFVQLNRQNEVSQSDRLIWLCNSFSKFELKTDAEIADDTLNGGNRKMTVCQTRYGMGTDENNYIRLNLMGSVNKIIEIGLKEDIETN